MPRTLPFPAPVLKNVSGPMGGGFLYTTGAEAKTNSAVDFKNYSTTTAHFVLSEDHLENDSAV